MNADGWVHQVERTAFKVNTGRNLSSVLRKLQMIFLNSYSLKCSACRRCPTCNHIAQRTVRADEVFIAGSTLGCFGVGCTPQASFTGFGFTFSGSTFATTTISGFSTLDGVANPGSNFNNLGSITMSTTPGNLTGQTLPLQVTFTAPQGFTGSNQITITYFITPFNMIGGMFLEPNPFNLTVIFNDLNREPNPTGGTPGQQTTCGTGSFRIGIFETRKKLKVARANKET